MPTGSLRFFSLGVVAFVGSVLCGVSWAQGPVLSATSTSVEASPVVQTPRLEGTDRHKFWDRKNGVLFAAIAGMNVVDFAVTRSNLQSGGQELNPLTRPFAGSSAGLALNFAGDTAGVIGLSYFFHKTGHHKLERIVSMVNISASGAAVGYGLTHR